MDGPGEEGHFFVSNRNYRFKRSRTVITMTIAAKKALVQINALRLGVSSLRLRCKYEGFCLCTIINLSLGEYHYHINIIGWLQATSLLHAHASLFLSEEKIHL
jgi:hypothetical protein